MGIYINKGNEAFRCALNSDYVDKSGMIAVINQTLDTERRLTCVTRCRRFGKTMAAEMLYAYYDKSCDSRALFEGLEISKHPTFEQHLNKYPTIYLDITDFVTDYRKDPNIIQIIRQRLQKDIAKAYPDIPVQPEDTLMDTLMAITTHTHERFIMIIDEWDAICREFALGSKAMDEYVDLLRRLFKGGNSKKVFAGAYMTGILPIKKYNTQSALNNFEEYSMVAPAELAPYFGFTPNEVEHIAAKFESDIDELRNWYDGYQIGTERSIYNPFSIMRAARRHEYNNYWQATSAFDQVASYIDMNFDGLKDDIINMLAGGRCPVDTTSFSNDLHDVRLKDDVFTVLIHLGYLAYDDTEQECYIPNKEVRMEMANAVKSKHWKVAESLTASKRLLEATLAGDEEAVALGLELAHDESTSILSYNNENSLACAISIAYYYARNEYVIHREYATGKGFADLVFIPRKNVEKPAMVVELKVDQSADTAIDQIKHRNYPAKLADYSGDLLLVGINYDRESKQHQCTIQKCTLDGKEIIA